MNDSAGMRSYESAHILVAVVDAEDGAAPVKALF